MTEASGLDQFLALLLDNHEAAVAEHPGGPPGRFALERSHRRTVRCFATIAETDRRSAGRVVRRMHRQLWMLDDRGGGVLDPAHVEPVARALARRSLGVRDDAAVEEAEAVYAQIEDIRRQIPLSWSWKRARGAEPDDEAMRALERELDVLERRYAAIWVAWVTR